MIEKAPATGLLKKTGSRSVRITRNRIIKLKAWSIARPSGRARIETHQCLLSASTRHGIARPSGRARIETRSRPFRSPPTSASPGRQAGRGLKQNADAHASGDRDASPGRQAGRGLKHAVGRLEEHGFKGASPGRQAGRGLKRHHAGEYPASARRIARPSGRARIETR